MTHNRENESEMWEKGNFFLFFGITMLVLGTSWYEENFKKGKGEYVSVSHRLKKKGDPEVL